ncbi:MAG TPA: hypothetical protein VNZ52_15000 [Candidatus Thermoplasmatota archaeon]|nr:hypothetical protein [Candidatus Thermoplasmatota archaeon]
MPPDGGAVNDMERPELRNAQPGDAAAFREAPRSGSLFNIQAPTVFRLRHHADKADA